MNTSGFIGTVYLAMSGGVDSSVAALLLRQQGWKVIGIFMRPWQSPDMPCLWEHDRADALRVAIRLDIPFETWDFSSAYERRVSRPMVHAYRHGKTPNPDVECNRHIKFGLFARRAFREGADVIATGHYAQLKRGHMVKSADRSKDQTYFLWAVPPAILKKTLFPVGGILKSEVRAIARRAKLPVAEKKDSQGICFVGKLDMKQFLSTRIRQTKGFIVHVDGRTLGTHEGAAFYTIGQRHGLNIRDGGGPYYITATDTRRNFITVGPVDALYGTSARIKGLRWLGERPPRGSLMKAKIRYRSDEVPVSLRGNGLVFHRPVRAIAPGQSIVFYRGSRVLGGGILGKVASARRL